jgi:DNA polymerase-3 subunit epsilon
VLDGVKVVDSFRIYKQHFPRSLTDAVREYLGEELEGAHDALTDARASWRVLQAQMVRHNDLPETVAELHKVFFETPADGYLDPDGKLAWRFGRATINFGKHATLALDLVPATYLSWMVRDGDFSDNVKRIIREALRGNFPRRD